MQQKEKAGSNISETCKLGYFDSIQQSIRETPSKKGHIPDDKQRVINNIINTYINSDKYPENIEELHQSIVWLEPNQDKFEDSFKHGLHSFIKYSQYNQRLSSLSAEDIIQAFTQYCHQTINSLNRCIVVKDDSQSEVLHLIIKSPKLFTPTIFEYLCSEIPNNPLLSIASIKSLIRDRTPNLSGVVAQKTEIFQKLLSNPEVSQLGLSLKTLQGIVIKQANPEKYIQEHYFGFQKEKTKPRSVCKSEEITFVSIERLIEKILYARKKVAILRQHRNNPEKLAELLTQTQELYNDISDTISSNNSKAEIVPRKRKKIPSIEIVNRLIPSNFKHQSFFRDHLIQIAVDKQSKKGKKEKPVKIWKKFLEIKRSVKEKQLFDNQAIKYLIATDSDLSLEKLSEMNSTHKELESLYQGSNKSYFAKGFFLKTAVLFYKDKNRIKDFIGQVYESIKLLETDFSQEKNGFTNGNIKILLSYVLKYKESARQKLKSDTIKYARLLKEFEFDKSIPQITPENTKNIFRYAVIQSHLEAHEFINIGKHICETLSDKYKDDKVLGSYLSEAILISAFFFQEKAEEYLCGLIKRVSFYQNKYPKISKKTIIETLIRYPENYPQRLENRNKNADTEYFTPKQMSLDYPLYKLQLQTEASKSQKQTPSRVSLESLN